MKTLALLPTTAPTADLESAQTSRIRFVEDPELGNVVVRWRYRLGSDKSPRWRCSGCGARGDGADECEHIFAAAISLANDLLGLVAAGLPESSTPTDQRNHP